MTPTSSPLGGHHAPASTASAATTDAGAGHMRSPPSQAEGGDDALLSPVSQLNHARERARQDQQARMDALARERRIKKESRAETGSEANANANGGVKRKLLEVAAAATAARIASSASSASSVAHQKKKSRMSTPMQRSTRAHELAARRATSHGGGALPSSPSTQAVRSRVSMPISSSSHHGANTPQAHGKTPPSSPKQQQQQEQQQDPDEEFNHAPAFGSRYLSYLQNRPHTPPPPSPPPSSFSSAVQMPRGHSEAHQLFSRHADPSVRTPPPQSSMSFTSHRARREPERSAASSSVASTSPSSTVIDTPPVSPASPSSRGLPPHPSFQLLTPNTDDGMVDLDRVHETALLTMETVEGDDILSLMLGQSTPRKGRHFPSERTRTASEEREMQFLRRRRLSSRDPAGRVARRQLGLGVVTDDMLQKQTGGSSSARINGDDDGGEKDVMVIDGRRRPPSPQAAALQRDEEQEEGDDDDSTEKQVKRLGQAQHLNVATLLLWLCGTTGLLCLGVVAVPLLRVLFTPSLPFCDGNTMALATGAAPPVNGGALVVTVEDSAYTALQPFRAECRNCPLFGVCTQGQLQRCVAPFERRGESCVESRDVQHALDQIAASIDAFVREQAVVQICGPSLGLDDWFWPGSSSATLQQGMSRVSELSSLASAHVEVFLSDLRRLVLQSSVTMEALRGVSHDYIFNRSLDLAMAGLQSVVRVVGDLEEDVRLHLAAQLAPWTCRARNELANNIPLVLSLVLVLVFLALLYRKWRLYQAERVLVDRLVREVRYFLIGRAHRTERFYPASHLRDNLFETLPNLARRDRKWLRDSVWPKVAALVGEDSRVRSRFAPIHGHQMAVWEWISSSSPRHTPESTRKRMRDPRKRFSL